MKAPQFVGQGRFVVEETYCGGAQVVRGEAKVGELASAEKARLCRIGEFLSGIQESTG